MTKPIQIKNLTIGAGIPKICVPLTGNHRKKKICQEAKDAKKAGADLVEWRADFFEGLMDKEACKQVLGKLWKSLERLRFFFYYPHKKGGGEYCHLHGRLQRMLPKRCQKPHSRPCGCGSDGKSRREEKNWWQSFKGKVSKSLLLPTILTKQTVRKSFWTVSVKWKNPELIF